MTPGADSDAILIAHMRDCIGRIDEYTDGDRRRFDASRLIQDGVIRNLQTLSESSQRLSDGIKATEPLLPWRDLSGFHNVVVHAYLSLDLGVIWATVEQDLPSLLMRSSAGPRVWHPRLEPHVAVLARRLRAVSRSPLPGDLASWPRNLRRWIAS